METCVTLTLLSKEGKEDVFNVMWSAIPRRGDHIMHEDVKYQISNILWYVDGTVTIYANKEEQKMCPHCIWTAMLIVLVGIPGLGWLLKLGISRLKLGVSDRNQHWDIYDSGFESVASPPNDHRMPR